MIKKNKYPLSLINETLARLGYTKFFTKLNIRQTFHRIRIKEENENLIIFRTRFKAFKYRVMPFNLTNRPASYQHFINNVLFNFLDNFTSAYLDNILIYNGTLEEHREYIKKVLERLRKAGL